jgi:hypothetical protein
MGSMPNTERRRLYLHGEYWCGIRWRCTAALRLDTGMRQAKVKENARNPEGGLWEQSSIGLREPVAGEFPAVQMSDGRLKVHWIMGMGGDGSIGGGVKPTGNMVPA